MVDQGKPALSPVITRWDLWLGGVAFCFALTVGALVLFADQMVGQHAPAAAFVVVVVGYAGVKDRRTRRVVMRLLRALGDRVGVGEPQPLVRPRVVDGDTIDDAATNTRYRLANIDAPETGENAKCFRERRVGELAKSVAMQLVARASVVSVRRTWRVDRHGRTVAYVFVDGVDLGEVLVERGLARPWQGRRAPWCGATGPLAKMAALRGEQLSCATCAGWRRGRGAATGAHQKITKGWGPG